MIHGEVFSRRVFNRGFKEQVIQGIGTESLFGKCLNPGVVHPLLLFDKQGVKVEGQVITRGDVFDRVVQGKGLQRFFHHGLVEHEGFIHGLGYSLELDQNV